MLENKSPGGDENAPNCRRGPSRWSRSPPLTSPVVLQVRCLASPYFFKQLVVGRSRACSLLDSPVLPRTRRRGYNRAAADARDGSWGSLCRSTPRGHPLSCLVASGPREPGPFVMGFCLLDCLGRPIIWSADSRAQPRSPAVFVSANAGSNRLQPCREAVGGRCSWLARCGPNAQASFRGAILGIGGGGAEILGSKEGPAPAGRRGEP